MQTVFIFRKIPALLAGKFYQCRKEAKWKHWFHLKCFNTDRSGDPICPHCGEKSEQHEIKLKLKVFEASACERILGESGDRVVQETGGASSSAATSGQTSGDSSVKSDSTNQLVPTANPPKRAKMCFEQYFKKTGGETSSVNGKQKIKAEPEKFGFDASLVVNVKKNDGSEFKFRHMPLGLPPDIMVIDRF